MRIVGLVFFVLLGTTQASPATTPPDALLVLSKADHTLAIVDPFSLKVVAKAPVGEDPHEVIASSDGRFAYVSNYGGGSFNTLAVIDLVVQKALPSINLGALRGPHGLTYVGGKLWFTAEGAKAVARFDPSKNAIDWVMGTGQDRTHMLIVSESQDSVFTTNVSSATVSILEKTSRPSFGGPPPGPPPGLPPAASLARRGPASPPGANWEQTIIAVGRGAEGFDRAPDGKELWTANAQSGTITVIDLGTRKVVDTLQAHVAGANRLKFTPDGKLVFVSSLSGPELTILNASTRQEVKRLNLEHGAAGIQMQPDGSRVYVACTGGGYVAVISLKSLEITARIDAGPEPDGLAWATRR